MDSQSKWTKKMTTNGLKHYFFCYHLKGIVLFLGRPTYYSFSKTAVVLPIRVNLA